LAHPALRVLTGPPERLGLRERRDKPVRPVLQDWLVTLDPAVLRERPAPSVPPAFWVPQGLRASLVEPGLLVRQGLRGVRVRVGCQDPQAELVSLVYPVLPVHRDHLDPQAQPVHREQMETLVQAGR
jgi:hypothetical protein